MPDMRERGRKIKEEFKHLKEIRDIFDPEVDEVIRFCDPSIQGVKKNKKGQRTGQDIYDGTARIALNLLVDGMVGYLCSQNLKWFRFALPVKYNWANGISQRIDELDEVKQWLQNCEEVQYSALERSNFYDMMPQYIRNGAAPGTSHIMAEENVGEGRIYFSIPHYRECYIAENHYHKVDTHYRCFSMNLLQLADKFGFDYMAKFDINFATAFQSNPYTDKEIIHAIFPRKNRDKLLGDGKNKPIASIWMYEDKDEILDEGGYNSSPVITWRWRKNSDELYGRSPAWDAMVDIKLANQQGRSNLKAGHKMVEPAMIAPSILRGKINLRPNGWTFYDGDYRSQKPEPIETGIQLPFGIELQDRQKKIIEDHFAVEFFYALTRAAAENTELTATQVIEMMGEKAAILGTRVGMFQSEGMDPLMMRVYDIEANAGRMPKPPDIVLEAMANKPKVEYLGPLAQAQKYLSLMRSMRSGLQIITEMSQIHPGAVDNFDLDAIARDIPNVVGFPEKYIRDPLMVADIRQARQQEEERMKQIAGMEEQAKALRLAGFKPEQGSLSDKLINGEQNA